MAEEGLENCWRRHRLCADHLHSGLADLGLELFVSDPASRLPTVTTIKVPEGINWQAVAGHCMKKYDNSDINCNRSDLSFQSPRGDLWRSWPQRRQGLEDRRDGKQR